MYIIRAGDWHCVSIIVLTSASLCFLLCLCVTLFVCTNLCLGNVDVEVNTCAYTQQKQHKSLLSGVDRRPPLWASDVLVLQISLKIYSCESGYPTLLRTVGAQCEHSRRSDDILPTSQSLTVPETSTSDCAEIDRSFLCSLSPSPFLFLYLFDI